MLNHIDLSKAILQPIETPFEKKVNLFMLRLDLLDEDISGNKWFKLKKNIEEAKRLCKKQIITFGGAFSNHIAATAKACSIAGFDSIGIIRGEEIANHTLKKAALNGMKLRFVSRGLYRDKQQLLAWLAQEYNLDESLVIPEGGANAAGIEGCKEIVSLINCTFNYIAVACGTGTTLAGIMQQLNHNQKGLGISALKGGAFLYDEIINGIPKNKCQNLEIIEQYHFGGYAKYSPELLIFIKDFYMKYNIKLDFIYTAKLMFGLFDLIQQNYFPENATIIAIHSGGLQGNEGIGI